MNRSLYPEGVEVHQDDLVNTENTKSNNILRRHIDNSLTGVVDGLAVTPNTGNPSLINVLSGSGYAPNGELIVVPTNINAIQLADSSLGIDNLIVAVYTETNDKLRAHETIGSNFPTRSNSSFRIRVFTQSQFDDLPETDNNLSNDSRDRSLILAVVTAQGSGVAITESNITSPPIFDSAITLEQVTANITGIELIQASPGTPNGNGTLQFTFSNTTIVWIAPTDTSGDSVNIGTSGDFTLRSLPSGNTLSISVSTSLLPASDQSDTISVQNLYFNKAPRHSSNDIHHRSLIGSGTPTSSNPHGLTLEDLGITGDVVVDHQNLFHSNGIHKDSDPNTFLSSVNTGPAPDTLNIQSPTGFRLYLGGSLHTSISTTELLFDDITDDAQILFNIYLARGVGGSSIATVDRRERIRYDVIPPPPLSGVAQLRDLNDGAPDGTAQIFYDDTLKTLSFKGPGDSGFGSTVLVPTSGSAPIRLFNDTDEYFIDLFVDDLSNWGSLDGGGDITEDLTISLLPTSSELAIRLKISSVMFSGSNTGFLGNGFLTSNGPNEVIDHRLFGITGPEDLRDDVLLWIDSVSQDPLLTSAAVTRRDILIAPSSIPRFPTGTSRLEVVGDTNQDAIRAVAGSGAIAGRFEGDLDITNNINIGNNITVDGVVNGAINIGDTDFVLDLNSGSPRIYLDLSNNDFIQYNRVDDELSVFISGTEEVRVDSSALFTGSIEPLLTFPSIGNLANPYGSIFTNDISTLSTFTVVPSTPAHLTVRHASNAIVVSGKINANGTPVLSPKWNINVSSTSNPSTGRYLIALEEEVSTDSAIHVTVESTSALHGTGFFNNSLEIEVRIWDNTGTLTDNTFFISVIGRPETEP